MSDTEAPEVIDAPPGFEDGTAFEAGSADDAPQEAAAEAALEAPAAEPEPVPVAPPPPPPPDPARGILRDLQAERQARQEAQAEAARLRGQIEGLEMAQRRGPQAHEPAQRSPEATQAATTWAHRLGLYTPAGEPDLVAAEAALTDIRQMAKQDTAAEVESRLAPIVGVLQQAHQQSVTAQAQTQKQGILKVGVELGADQSLLNQILDNAIAVNPALLENQEAVVGILAMASGMTSLANPGAPRAAAPAAQVAAPIVIPQPNMTERPGRPTTTVKPLVGIERVIASKRGISTEKWAANNKAFDEHMDPARGLVAED